MSGTKFPDVASRNQRMKHGNMEANASHAISSQTERLSRISSEGKSKTILGSRSFHDCLPNEILTRPSGQISLARATRRLGGRRWRRHPLAKSRSDPRLVIGPVNGARTSGPRVNSISCERVDSIRRRSTNRGVPATAEQCDHSGTSI